MMHRVCGALVLLILTATLAMAHDLLDWMRPYTNERAVACCGSSDCIPASVTYHGDGMVIVNGVMLRVHPGRVHQLPDAIEARGYWCYDPTYTYCQAPEYRLAEECTRCVFYNPHPGEG